MGNVCERWGTDSSILSFGQNTYLRQNLGEGRGALQTGGNQALTKRGFRQFQQML